MAQRLRLFLNALTLHVFAANAHGHLHEHSLAAAVARLGSWMHLGLTHPYLSLSTIPGDTKLSSGVQASVSKKVTAN